MGSSDIGAVSRIGSQISDFRRGTFKLRRAEEER